MTRRGRTVTAWLLAVVLLVALGMIAAAMLAVVIGGIVAVTSCKSRTPPAPEPADDRLSSNRRAHSCPLVGMFGATAAMQTTSASWNDSANFAAEVSSGNWGTVPRRRHQLSERAGSARATRTR